LKRKEKCGEMKKGKEEESGERKVVRKMKTEGKRQGKTKVEKEEKEGKEKEMENGSRIKTAEKEKLTRRKGRECKERLWK
jgi:hypothetical protein